MVVNDIKIAIGFDGVKGKIEMSLESLEWCVVVGVVDGIDEPALVLSVGWCAVAHPPCTISEELYLDIIALLQRTHQAFDDELDAAIAFDGQGQPRWGNNCHS